MALRKRWIQSAIKRPGSLTARARRNGVSTRQQAIKDARSPNPSIRSSGVLAKRFLGIAKRGNITRRRKHTPLRAASKRA